MKYAPIRVFPAIFFVALAHLAISAPPISAPDNFSTAEDTALIAPAVSGVLANDNPNGNPLIEAMLATPPAHGTVSINPDGSFTFTPAANYAGADSFSYKARNVVQPIPFDIDEASSNSTISVRVRGPLGIDQTRSDTSRIDGTTMVGVLEPRTTGPFNLIQVTGLNAVLIDDIALNYNFGFFIGTANITADPGAITVSMDAAGAAAPVNGAGQFTQTGNTLAGDGTVHVKYNVTIVGSSESDESLNHATAVSDFTNASIVSNGTTMTLTLPIDFTRNDIVIDETNGITADIHIVGTIVATAPASENVTEESAPAPVSLNIVPVNDPPVAVAESYVARESTPMTITATPAQSVEELVPAGSVWKYRYDGQDPGTAWKDWLHNDSTWPSGPAQLGFGDPEIVTNIRPGATPNYTTAYFRRAFTVSNLSNTRPGVKLYVKRDDAVAVYLNGVQVYRDPELPADATYETFATPQRPEAEENVFVEITLSRGLLFDGVNVLAAEVHQTSPTSGDLRFDARLTRELGAPGVLANDTDIDSPLANLTASVLAQPAHGLLSLSVNGGFTYTPAAGYIGADSFAYRVSDGAMPNTTPLTILPRGSNWRYLADGTDQGLAWRAAAFDDSLWPTGLAELGYGDAGEGRPEATDIRPDTVNTPIYATYYFRTHFTAPADLAFVTNVRGRILRDDAAAIYINGVQVFRDATLPAGALFSDFSTGQTPSETDYTEFAIPVSMLIAGDNVIAVEVHQVTGTSSDVSFDFELVANVVPGARVSINVLNDDADLDGMSDTWERANGLNYLLAADATIDADGDGRSNRSEFLAGTDPNDSAQFLRATSVMRSGTDLIVVFSGTVAGRTYRLESSPDLVTWPDIGAVITATGPTLTLAIPFGLEVRRVHRLRSLYTFP